MVCIKAARPASFKVVDPDGRDKDRFANISDTVPGDALLLVDLTPGIPPKWAQPRLELLASQVLPAFR